MAGNKINVDEYHAGSKMQRIGLLLALAFYIVSVAAVVRNRYGDSIFDPDVKVITFAHWQLEDGFREGIAEAIKSFEAMYAAKGEKVKVVQSAIPARTYKQWLQTQLISGNPADVIELNCSPNMLSMYFVPLSPYIGEPNPYNAGTPLEGIPWSDTYVDDMNSSLDGTFAEYFGVSAFFFTNRMYVNLDLLERATGSRKMPEDLAEWMAMCRQIKEYGEKIGQPLIPVGTRGIDRGTIGQLFGYYYQQLNGDLSDDFSVYELGCTISDQLAAIRRGDFNKEKLLAANEIMSEIGSYFADGFSAIDLEQTKFLFASGRVAFFPEGTWNAYSMVRNASFDVGITEVPVVGKNHKYSKYYLGPPIEIGSGAGQAFGITKASKHFDLALSFLQYITSYRINQMIVVDHANWLSILKKVEYSTPLMKSIEPHDEGSYLQVATPLHFGRAQMLEEQETAIQKRTADTSAAIYANFIAVSQKLDEDLSENLLSEKRNLINIESLRSATDLGLMADPDGEDAARLTRQRLMNFENLISRNRSLRNFKVQREEIHLLRNQAE